MYGSFHGWINSLKLWRFGFEVVWSDRKAWTALQPTHCSSWNIINLHSKTKVVWWSSDKGCPPPYMSACALANSNVYVYVVYVPCSRSISSLVPLHADVLCCGTIQDVIYWLVLKPVCSCGIIKIKPKSILKQGRATACNLMTTCHRLIYSWLWW